MSQVIRQLENLSKEMLWIKELKKVREVDVLEFAAKSYGHLHKGELEVIVLSCLVS